MKSNNLNSKKFNRKQIVMLWKNKCIYDDNNLDMVGLKMDINNIGSIHHIFGRGQNNKGLAVIGRLFHDYIDNYLKAKDNDEYIKWNNYFHKLYIYSLSMKKDYDKEKLIKECNELLCNILNNKSEGAKYYVDKLKPYLHSRMSRYIVEIFETTKFSENEFVPRSILIDKQKLAKINEEYFHIPKEETSRIVREYICKKTESHFMTKNCTVDLSYKIMPSTFEELLSKYRITSINLNDRSKQLIKEKSKPGYDWMGSIAYPEDIIDEEFFITKLNREILDYLFYKKPKYYDRWVELFDQYKNENSNKKRLLTKALTLRNKTINYIYISEICQPDKLYIKNRIHKKFNSMTEEERRQAYHDSTKKGQYVVEFVIMMNKSRNDKLKKEKQEQLKRQIASCYYPFLNIKASDINTSNINYQLKNDEMGNDFSDGKYIPTNQSRIETNFLSTKSLRTLKLLKKNQPLLERWIKYLDYIARVREFDVSFFECNKNRRDLLFKIHRELLTLRKLTREYFINREKGTNNVLEKIVCQEMINTYREKEIHFWIKYHNNQYNSDEYKNRYNNYILKQQEKKLSRLEKKRKQEEKNAYYDSFRITNDSYGRYVSDIYNRRFTAPSKTKVTDNSVHINRTEEYRNMVKNKCNTDAFGLYIGQSSETEINVVELIGFDIFLTEQSYYILKYLKENNYILFTRWVSLFYQRENGEIEEEAYNLEFYELLRETSSFLTPNYSTFEGPLKSGSIRVYKAVSKYRKTRK